MEAKHVDLTALRSKILSRVSGAAQSGDIAAVARWSNAAQECDAIAREQLRLKERIETFAASLEQPTAAVSAEPVTNGQVVHSTRSAKRDGAMARAEWVEHLARLGIRLQGHGKRFATPAGASVAVGFANELPGLPNKWFLGTGDEPIDVVVLLCRDARLKLHDIVIPVSALGGRWKLLARSNGQIKFNVRKDVSDFLLLIPGTEPFVVTPYVGRYQALNGAA